MVRIIRNSRVFHSALMVWALFLPAMWVLSRDDMFAMTGAMAFVSSLSVIHAYWPAMKTALRHNRGEFDYVDFLTLGIMCAWAATAGRMGFILYLRFSLDVPDNLSSYFIAFLQYLAFTGALLHLSARRSIKNHVPTQSWPRVGITIALGFALGFFLSVSN